MWCSYVLVDSSALGGVGSRPMNIIRHHIVANLRMLLYFCYVYCCCCCCSPVLPFFDCCVFNGWVCSSLHSCSVACHHYLLDHELIANCVWLCSVFVRYLTSSLLGPPKSPQQHISQLLASNSSPTRHSVYTLFGSTQVFNEPQCIHTVWLNTSLQQASVYTHCLAPYFFKDLTDLLCLFFCSGSLMCLHSVGGINSS